MNEIANATTGTPSVLDGLAMQARALRLSINVNMWQLARVFIEAKELVPHGEWGKWLKENADVGERTAQDMMAAYRRFGGKAPFEGLTPTQTFKLLPLPEGTEDRFMEEHDVQNMSTREIQEAVKRTREEMEQEKQSAILETRNAAQSILDKVKEARDSAEKRALDAEVRARKAERQLSEAESRATGIPPEMAEELERTKRLAEERENELRRIAEQGAESLAEQRRLAEENNRLRRDMEEQEKMLREQQDALNHAQEELLNYQSAQARGEERDYSDELTLDVFGAAVREFVGICARMPYMGAAFSQMDNRTLNEYFQLLKTVEGWAEGARQAMIAVNGGVVVE